MITGATAEEANRLLAGGMGGAAVAREPGVPPSTVYHNIHRGLIGAGAPAAGKASAGTGADAGSVAGEAPPGRSERDRRDRAAPMGRAARDCAGRVAASAGAMEEALPRFGEPLSAVARGGVLAALPALLEEGLLRRADRFLSLPKGYYGLTSTLLLPAFLFLARVRNPEALRHEAPGEWGAVPGLDRCPEAKTLRRKVRAPAADERRVKGWQDALARDWMADGGDTVATLSVDGHVKACAGRKGRLRAAPEALPAGLGGLLCLHRDLDPGMARALERDVLPALERIGLPGPDAPDLTASGDAAPALTLVFDREGWSPAPFARLARRGVAVITWHKGFRGGDWPEAEFRAVGTPIHGPGGTGSAEARLAERRIRLGGGPEVRQIRRLLDTGRQVPPVTTDPVTPTERIAGALFPRWARESFFRYMCGDLPTHVRVAEPGEGGTLDALPSGERPLLDVIRMIACRAETRMMPAVAAA